MLFDLIELFEGPVIVKGEKVIRMHAVCNQRKGNLPIQEFLAKKPEIESTFGEPLSWEKMAKTCRVAYYRENVSVKNVPEDFEDWAVETMKKFRDTFMPIIRDLS